MNEKRSLQDIIDLLAEKHALSKKDAEAVAKGMFDLIEEALDRDKYVKVKGLGTFKLTEVESRESVDVNTGERIEIRGHTKVSFTPDASMKEQINKPFAHFETVVLNENTQLEDTLTETEEELAEELRKENDADAVAGMLDTDERKLQLAAAQKGMEPAKPMAENVASAASARSGAEPVAKSVIEVGAERVLSVDDPSGCAPVSGTSQQESSVSQPEPVVAGNDSLSGPGEPNRTTGETQPLLKEPIDSEGQTAAMKDEQETEEETKETVVLKPETEIASLTIVAKKVEITSETVHAHGVVDTDDDIPVTPEPLGGDSATKQEEEVKVTATASSSVHLKLAVYRRWIGILCILLFLSLLLGVYLFLENRKSGAPAPVMPTSEQTDRVQSSANEQSSATVQPAGIEQASENMQSSETEQSSETARAEETAVTEEVGKQKPEGESTDSRALAGGPDAQPVPAAPVNVQKEKPLVEGNKPERPATLNDTLDYEIAGTQTTHTLKEGESLIKLSVKYFGTKAMWPYIVKHNSDVIQDANRVPIGTRLRIPKLTPRS